MTPEEHKAEAERLADKAHHFTWGDGADPVTGAALAAEAQVHATLALVGATLLAGAAGYDTARDRLADAVLGVQR
jgi:hypothetical protein